MSARRRWIQLGLAAATVFAVLGGRATPAAAYYLRDWAATANYEFAPSLNTALSSCDDCNAVLTLPFAFPFYGKTYTTITVSSNGMLRLGSFSDGPSTTAYNKKLSFDGLPTYDYPLIAPLWDDWDTLLGGSVYTGRPTATGPFVIEWYQVKHHSQTASNGYSFEVKLFPSGNIEFQYGNVVNGQIFDRGGDASIGYQEGGTTVGLPFAYKNSQAVQSNSGMRWTYPGRVAFYTKVLDGVRPVPEPRSNLLISLGVHCNGDHPNTWSYINLTTWGWSTEGWTFLAQPGGCPNTTGMTVQAEKPIPRDGFDLVTLALDPSIRQVTSGLYHFYVRSDLTPAPSVPVRWDYVWNVSGGQVNVKSKLDYWQSGAFDKPILIITGFDPLNEDSTASYLALMTGLVRPLLAEGFDVGIGKFAYGNLSLPTFRDETGRWINDAYTRSGNHKVQVAGVSMGGIVLRHTLATNYLGSAANVSAWYSVDSPQKGANLGRGSVGVQNLVACNKSPSDPAYKKLFSAPSADMNMRWVTSCTCSEEPENSRCNSTAANHDAYYNSVGWPSSSIPRYALAFGDGTGTWTHVGGGTLYDFYYGGTCSDDGDWGGGSRDIMAGSRYLDAAQVNSSLNHWFCGNSGVRLNWEPAFINVDSALAGVTTPEYDAEGTSAPNYTVSVTRWSGWFANDWNEYHKVVSEGIINQTMAWVRSHQ